MPTLGIRQDTWQGLRQNQRQIMRWAFTLLHLGVHPAVYETPSAVSWFVFDDHRLSLHMFARLGTLANEVAGLSPGWKPPTIGTGQNKVIDRAAVEAKAIELVQASIVLPEDIVYSEFDPNPYQTTLDANSAPASMQGGSAVPDSWVSVP